MDMPVELARYESVLACALAMTPAPVIEPLPFVLQLNLTDPGRAL